MPVQVKKILSNMLAHVSSRKHNLDQHDNNKEIKLQKKIIR